MYLANKVQNIKGSRRLAGVCGTDFDELRPVADAMEQGGAKAAARRNNDILRKVCALLGPQKNASSKLKSTAMPVALISCWRFGETIESGRPSVRRDRAAHFKR